MNRLQTKQSQMFNLLNNNWKQINSVLPEHLTPERMLRLAYNAMTRQPGLLECSDVSIINGILAASSMGLEIGTPLGLAHLVPFNNRKTKTKEATLIIGYQGYIKMAYQSGLVKSISFHSVYKGDLFEYEYGTNPSLTHKPGETKEKKGLLFAYAVVHYQTGGFDFEVVTPADADLAKKKSAAQYKKNSPWNDEDLKYTMWQKTAIRRLAKRMPQASQLLRASAIEAHGVSSIEPYITPEATKKEKPMAAITNFVHGEESPEEPYCFGCNFYDPNKGCKENVVAFKAIFAGEQSCQNYKNKAEADTNANEKLWELFNNAIDAGNDPYEVFEKEGVSLKDSSPDDFLRMKFPDPDKLIGSLESLLSATKPKI